MWNFINRNYWNVVIVIVVVLALVLGVSLIAMRGSNTTPTLSNVVNVIFTPIKSGATGISNSVGGFFSDMANSGKAARENKDLRNKLKQLENENERLDEYIKENERLRKLIDLKNNHPQFTTTACNVVSRSFSNWSTQFIIDKGKNSGIDIGNVVIENGGLVGSVTEAGENWALVTTVLDSDESVGASVIRTGETGIVEGSVKMTGDNLCSLNFTQKDADIAVGDTVETSGLGKIYPKGIIIGKVKSVESKTGQVTKEITVEISADIHNLKEVLVITSY